MSMGRLVKSLVVKVGRQTFQRQFVKVFEFEKVQES